MIRSEFKADARTPIEWVSEWVGVLDEVWKVGYIRNHPSSQL